MKITSKEFEAYQREGRKVLSDIDFSYNSETKEYDVPAVEWEDYMGRWWVRYESEEAREKALNQYQYDLEFWVKKYRIEEKIREEKRIAKEREIAESKTLGGMFPELAELKLKMSEI